MSVPALLGTAPPPEPAPGLARRASAAVGWNIAGDAVRSAASLAIGLLLTRLLGPEPFGLVALAMVVIAFSNLLVESGIGARIIQKPVLTALEIRTAFTLQLLAGVSLAAALALTAPLLAAFYSQSALTPVMRALALLPLLVSAGQTSTALLRRELQFRKIQTIQIGSYLLGYGAVGIPLALKGAAVWALVLAQLAQATLYSAGSWALVRHSLALRLGPESRSLLGFGVPVLGGNVFSWIVGALPSVFIGRSLGVARLGLYNRAYMLVGVPLTSLAASFQTVSLSLYSRLQDREAAQRRAFLAILALIALVAFPAFSLIAATASPLIQVLLGGRWAPAAPVLVPLALAMPLDAIAAVTSPLLLSRARPDLELRLQAIAATSGALALTTAAIASAPLVTVAWTVCVAIYLVRAVTALALAGHVLGLLWRDLGKTLLGGSLLGAAVFSAAVLSLRLAGSLAPVRLLVAAVGGAGVGLLLLATLPSLVIHPGVLWLLLHRGVPIPPVLRRWMVSLRERSME
jgi:O-antigen/teichoic acid export membrane protein